MYEAQYYRHQADRARRMARQLHQPDATDLLLQMAVDYEQVAEDLEKGAIEIRHADLMPQNRKRRH